MPSASAFTAKAISAPNRAAKLSRIFSRRSKSDGAELGFLKLRLGWFRDRLVAFPAFIFQFELLDGDGIRIGIQVWQDLVFRDPTAVDFVRQNKLPAFVVDIESNLLAEVFERNFRTQTRP